MKKKDYNYTEVEWLMGSGSVSSIDIRATYVNFCIMNGTLKFKFTNNIFKRFELKIFQIKFFLI